MAKLLYLDQCAFTKVAGEPGSDWHNSEWGEPLSEAVNASKVEVWASPTHASETLLCGSFAEDGTLIPDEKCNRRQHLARTIVDIIHAKRMRPSFDVLAVQELINQAAEINDDSVKKNSVFLRVSAERNAYRWLGLLGLLGSYQLYNNADLVNQVRRAKLTNSLWHSRKVKDPDAFAKRIIECARNNEVTDTDIWADVNAMSFAEMEAETEANLVNAQRLSRDVRKELHEHRRLIMQVYGTSDLAACVESCAPTCSALTQLFSPSVIRANWSTISKVCNFREPLPSEIREATDEEILSPPLLERLLEHVFRIFTFEKLAIPAILQSVVLSQIERCFSQETKGKAEKTIPSAGIALDSEHATALMWADLFVTTDKNLADACEEAKRIITQVYGRHFPVATVAFQINQFKAELNKAG